jgi:hypothetical protein
VASASVAIHLDQRVHLEDEEGRPYQAEEEDRVGLLVVAADRVGLLVVVADRVGLLAVVAEEEGHQLEEEAEELHLLVVVEREEELHLLAVAEEEALRSLEHRQLHLLAAAAVLRSLEQLHLLVVEAAAVLRSLGPRQPLHHQLVAEVAGLRHRLWGVGVEAPRHLQPFRAPTRNCVLSTWRLQSSIA